MKLKNQNTNKRKLINRLIEEKIDSKNLKISVCLDITKPPTTPCGSGRCRA